MAKPLESWLSTKLNRLIRCESSEMANILFDGKVYTELIASYGIPTSDVLKGADNASEAFANLKSLNFTLGLIGLQQDDEFLTKIAHRDHLSSADGRTLPGRISQTPGGVGRNIADSLGKLRASDGSAGSSTSFISALGKDQFGEFLMESVKHLNTSGIRVLDHARTACYCALIDKKGDAKVGVGDMEIHSHISPLQIVDNRSALAESSFIVLDGNVPGETIDNVLDISIKNKIPVWFEPTDVLKAPKPFKTNLWTSIACSSPNMNELKEMARAAGVRMNEELILEDVDRLLKQLVYLGQPLAEHIPVLMITMGKLGILMLSHCKSDESPRNTLIRKEQPAICARYYPSVPLSNVTNSLGAGDSTAAGFIDGLLRGLTEPECVALGHLASREALQSPMAVPREFKSYDPISQTKAAYHEIPLG